MTDEEKEYKTIIDRWIEDEDGFGCPDEESLEDYVRRIKKERESQSD